MYNFLNVCAAVPKLALGDPHANKKEIIQTINESNKKGVNILVFPELSLCGVTCGDLFFQPTLIDSCEQALADIITQTEQTSILVFVGLPTKVRGGLYNCMAAICNGEILAFIAKHPTGQQKRWFDIMPEQTTVFELGNATVEVLQPNSPRAAKILIDPWSSAENIMIDKIAQAKAKSADCVLIQVGSGIMESSTDGVYSGYSAIIQNGQILATGEKYSQNTTVITASIDIDTLEGSKKLIGFDDNDEIELITVEDFKQSPIIEQAICAVPFVVEQSQLPNVLQATQAALARRLVHTQSKKAIIGVSGGVDSTLALIITAGAFKMLGKDPRDIVAITMPGFGTSKQTYNNATELIQCVGASFKEINIATAVNQHFKDIGHDPNKKDITYENAQARERTQILMDIANMENGIVIGTGGMSEAALGFCTYGGDHISMYNVNAALPKTLIIAILRHIQQTNTTLSKPLEKILNTPISPELLPPKPDGQMAQKTEDIVGSYELNDFFLFYILNNTPPKKI